MVIVISYILVFIRLSRSLPSVRANRFKMTAVFMTSRLSVAVVLLLAIAVSIRDVTCKTSKYNNKYDTVIINCHVLTYFRNRQVGLMSFKKDVVSCSNAQVTNLTLVRSIETSRNVWG